MVDGSTRPKPNLRVVNSGKSVGTPGRTERVCLGFAQSDTKVQLRRPKSVQVAAGPAQEQTPAQFYPTRTRNLLGWLGRKFLDGPRCTGTGRWAGPPVGTRAQVVPLWVRINWLSPFTTTYFLARGARYRTYAVRAC